MRGGAARAWGKVEGGTGAHGVATANGGSRGKRAPCCAPCMYVDHLVRLVHLGRPGAWLPGASGSVVMRMSGIVEAAWRRGALLEGYVGFGQARSAAAC